MYRKLLISALYATSLATLLISCKKTDPVVSPVPVIQFKHITKFTLSASGSLAKRDSVVTTIAFSDGDGDLGEDTRDTVRLKQVFGNQNWSNYEIRTFQFVNGTFNEIIPVASPKAFFNQLSKPGDNKPINGTLDYGRNFVYADKYKMVPVKFQIRIRDRNLNESNVVETDTVRVPIVQ